MFGTLDTSQHGSYAERAHTSENRGIHLPSSDRVFTAFALTQHDIVINDVKLVTKEVSCCYSRDIILVAMVTRWLFLLITQEVGYRMLVRELGQIWRKKKGGGRQNIYLSFHWLKRDKIILIPINYK